MVAGAPPAAWTIVSGLFASLSIGKALEKLTSYLHVFSTAPSSSSSSAGQQQGDLEELRKLDRTMRRIQAMLHDAEEHWNIREESAKLRLKELKEVAYDMEDIVEEYEYEVRRCEVEALDRSPSVDSTSKRKRQMENEAYLMESGFVAVPDDLVLRAKKVTERLDEIIHDNDRFSLTVNDGEKITAPDITSFRHTSSVVCQKSILGREKERDRIVEDLLSHEGKSLANSVSVVAIVGMGGLGKTTLAQLVYNDPRVRQSFDKLAWVYVSENFDVIKITRNIIESLTKRTCERTEELEHLHQKLSNEIKQQRVLLVLDDIWNDRGDCWELLCMPMAAAKICQIIVTTRSTEVARLVQAMHCYHLGCLSFDDSWSLFSQAAFGEQESSDVPTNLIEIGKSIVQKCKGLPLAIKTLGRMLHYEPNERAWQHVFDSELWESEKPRDEVLPALELCYRHMPLHLRRCFVSLSLFPKGHHIQECELLKLWKQLDLIRCDGNDDQDEIGSQYIIDLLRRSILQVDSPPFWFIIHDLIHDLASFLGGEEFYGLDENTMNEIPQNVRYLCIHKSFFKVPSADIVSAFPHSLRAIIVVDDLAYMMEASLPKSLILNCKKLRTLDIGDSRSLLMVLPNFMGNLKLLRHLSFDPFYRLSTLHFQNLVLKGIGCLISLQTLPDIHISRCRCSFNIRELRNINEIRELHINGLSSISCIDDAKEAQMQRKKHLRSLYLSFSIVDRQCECGLQPESVAISHDRILDSLRPHRNLQTLSIGYYDSEKYPSWLGNANFSMLTHINLYCFRSKHLPVLGSLPSLKTFRVVSMNSLERIGHEFFRQLEGHKDFPSLIELEFEDLLKWTEWSGVDDGEFPCLKKLSILGCPKLRSFPLGQFRSLVTLNLKGCNSLATFPASPALRELKIEECSCLRKVPTLPSLLKLSIYKCPNLSSVGLLTALTVQQYSSVSAASSLPKLTTLKLKYCSNLRVIRILPKLTTLSITRCSGLRVVSSLPSLTTLELKESMQHDILCRLLDDLPSLECLRICNNHTVICLPLKHQSLPSLKRLCLVDCPDLIYCGGLARLTSLEHLEVWWCPKLPKYDPQQIQLKTLIIKY